MTSSPKSFGTAIGPASWMIGVPTRAGRLGELVVNASTGNVYQNIDGGSTWQLFAPVGGSVISDGSITLAKIVDIATQTIIGRTTAGDGAPEVLTAAQATAILASFAGTAKGLVPVSVGGSVNFLRADASWAPSIPNTFFSSLYGTGSDGACHFNGTDVVLGLTDVGGVYTLTRDIQPSSMIVDSGITINTGGYRIYVTGTLTNNGKITQNGTDGADAAAGPGQGAAATLSAGGTDGGNPGSTGSAGVTSGTPISSWVGSSVANGGATGGAGGNGFDGTVGPDIGRGGGGGGGGGVAGGSGGKGGNITLLPALNGATSLTAFLRGRPDSGNVVFTGGSGGGGGASGGGAAPAGAGGGGGGGMLICARLIAGSGSFECKGGQGGDGGGTTGGGGGAGGGGGGFQSIFYNSRSGTTTNSVAGGLGGAKGIGSNFSGGDGGPGASGTAYLFNMTSDGT